LAKKHEYKKLNGSVYLHYKLTRMVTPADIQSIVASGEGYNAEFKVSVPSKVRELTEEVCAFANAAGGIVLIGVDDQNRILGITM
jgi:ATP-dependent DNA helicase RecG